MRHIEFDDLPTKPTTSGLPGADAGLNALLRGVAAELQRHTGTPMEDLGQALRVVLAAGADYSGQKYMGARIMERVRTLQKRQISEPSRRGRVNAKLAEIGREFWHAIPLDRIIQALEENGFDGSPLGGFYCGSQGRVHEQVGKNTWIVLTWYRFETGRYEIVSYVS